MACSYLNFSIQKIHQNSKNGGFCEELLSENDFEAALVNFCCYEYSANASKAFQKISTRILLRVFQSEGEGASYDFFLNPPPAKTDAPPWGTPPLKNDASFHLKNNLHPLKHETPFHEMIPRKSTINHQFKSS